ncbi:hypothetical protein BHAOGJBA_6243 [Methylobacterium hispanicum]|jgi:hypothetical protein|uniref:Uncharacterized protein n=1 Tax=Methylobacterium hispanicum TaxID=270350 RepID=A0AAV4ZXD3_9HYPH|nr:hypothetical protein BHAOGJBA_6243 [Methylobacterium hispanicum]SFV15646.1 hypothetical protein SAMN02799643_06364 [Methylobacterium sp. UNCCL125]
MIYGRPGLIRRQAHVRGHTRIHRSAGTHGHGAIVAPRRPPMPNPLYALAPVIGTLAAFFGLMIVAYA